MSTDQKNTPATCHSEHSEESGEAHAAFEAVDSSLRSE
jgi:hypothetical protein